MEKYCLPALPYFSCLCEWQREIIRVLTMQGLKQWRIIICMNSKFSQSLIILSQLRLHTHREHFMLTVAHVKCKLLSWAKGNSNRRLTVFDFTLPSPHACPPILIFCCCDSYFVRCTSDCRTWNKFSESNHWERLLGTSFNISAKEEVPSFWRMQEKGLILSLHAWGLRLFHSFLFWLNLILGCMI